MCIATAVLAWMALGFAAWYIQIKQIGDWSAYDALMVAPCMVVGPFMLVTVLRGAASPSDQQ